MNRSIEEIVRMVAGSYAKKFQDIDKADLAQEIHLRILHGKEHTFDPTRGDFEPYARAIANRTAYAYVYAATCPVRGRTADLNNWKNIRGVPIGELSENDTKGNRNASCNPPSKDPNADEMMRTQEIITCLQRIFEENVEDGKLARGILLENRPAGEIAEENNVPEWRVYRATFRIRRAIKTHPRARLLWETR